MDARASFLELYETHGHIWNDMCEKDTFRSVYSGVCVATGRNMRYSGYYKSRDNTYCNPAHYRFQAGVIGNFKDSLKRTSAHVNAQ